MDSTTFDVIVIGAGPGGEAATHKARSLGAAVAVIDRKWFGGSCPHIGCLPSKALLHSAAEHHANPARYDWPRASKHRDFMINRPPDAAEPAKERLKQQLARVLEAETIETVEAAEAPKEIAAPPKRAGRRPLLGRRRTSKS